MKLIEEQSYPTYEEFRRFENDFNESEQKFFKSAYKQIKGWVNEVDDNVEDNEEYFYRYFYSLFRIRILMNDLDDALRGL